MSDLLLARAEHMTDWHAFIACPERGELGYCLEHGGDEVDLDTGQLTGDPWSPATATAALAAAGWTVVGTWRDAPPDADHQYEADVQRT